MNYLGTISSNNNSLGDGLQLTCVLANIDTWETLTDISARVCGNAGEGQHRMIWPDDIPDGSGHTRLESQSCSVQSFRSPIEIKSQVFDTIQIFFGWLNLGCLRIPKDQERTFSIWSDNCARERSSDSFTLLQQA